MKRPFIYLSTALLLLSVFAAPGMLGANREWSVALVTLGLATSLMLLAIKRPSYFSVSARASLHPIRWPMALAVIAFVIAGWPLLVARPESVEELLSLQGILSADHNMITQSLLGCVATCLAVLTAYLIGTARAAWRRHILYASVVVCVCYGVFGIFTDCLALEGICQAVSSLFVNRNSAATFLGFGLILSTLFLTEELDALSSDRSGRSSRRSIRWANWTTIVFGPAGLFAAAMLSTGAAILLTRSRGGFLAVVIALGLVSLFRYWQSKRGATRSRTTLLPLAIIALLGVIWISASSGLMMRFEGIDMAQDDRVFLFERTITMIGERPLTGHGLGTFQEALPRYRTFEMGPLPDYDKAHNSYLDLAAGIGLPGLLLIIATLAAVFYCLVRAAFSGRHPGTLALAGMAITAQIALHGVVDFSMQIPAVQVSFGLIIGIALASAVGNKAGKSEA